MLRLYAIAYLVFLYAPIVLLPVFALNDATIIAFPLSGFTPRWFAELAHQDALLGALRASFVIAITSALIATALATLAARAATQHDFFAKRSMIGFIMLPLVLPEIIVATSLLVLAVQVLGLPLSNLMVIAAHVLISMPFCIAILNGAFQNLDPALEEAAMDLGESRWSAFRRVTLPLIAPGLISALLIAFTISFDEFIIAFFFTASDPTLPVYIYGLLRFPARLPIVMALGTLLVLGSVLLLSLAEFYRRRGLARAGLKDKGGFL